jgi:hypothetical protein
MRSPVTLLEPRHPNPHVIPRVAAAVLSLLALPWLLAIPAQARDAASFGGNGGGEFRSKCPAGLAMFAYIGRAGTALDRIQPICIEVRADKGLGPRQDRGTDHGGNGGGVIQRTCPDSVVTSIRVFSGGDNLVSLIDLGCTNLKTGAQTAVSGRSAGKHTNNNLSTCNSDEIAVGIHGRHGAMIDRLGLICEKRSAVIPAPPIVVKKEEPKKEEPKKEEPSDPKTGCSGLSGEDQAICVEHNEKRALHGVPNLTWDPALAKNAAAWVKGCHTQKDKEGNTFFCHQSKNFGCGSDTNYKYGENLSWGSPTRTGTQAVDGWYCEIEVYDFDRPVLGGGVTHGCSGTANPNKVTGHFTQVVWKATTRLGCAKNKCSIDGTSHDLWACEYDPPGNFNANQPGVLSQNVPRPIKTFRSRRHVTSIQRVTTVMSDVDFYDQPGGSGKKISVLRKGQKLDLLTCRADNWCQLTGGWVWGSFITRDGSH